MIHYTKFTQPQTLKALYNLVTHIAENFDEML